MKRVKLSSTMKAYGQRKWGADSKYLELLNVPMPVLRRRDVLVKVYGAATNPVDIKRRRPPGDKKEGDDIGGFKVVGWDGSGVIEALGPQVSHFKVGDEVFFAGDVTRDGCYAEYVAVDERVIAHKPRSIDHATAAAVPLTALTAYEGFVESLRIESGKGLSVLIVGGAGGVGSICSQVAKNILQFDTVISTASRKETSEFCLLLGADVIINHYKPLYPQLKEKGFAKGVDVVFNCAEADKNWDEMAAVLKPLGRMLIITGMKRDVNLTPFMSKRCSIHYELMFSRLMLGDKPERQGEILDMFSRWVDEKKISPRVLPHFRMDVEDFKKAMDLQVEGKGIGKIVLDLSEWPSATGDYKKEEEKNK